jgi:hypothetical protein
MPYCISAVLAREAKFVGRVVPPLLWTCGCPWLRVLCTPGHRRIAVVRVVEQGSGYAGFLQVAVQGQDAAIPHVGERRVRLGRPRAPGELKHGHEVLELLRPGVHLLRRRR